MRKAPQFIFLAVIALFLYGCGGQSPVSSDPPGDPVTGNVPVGLTVTDTPPAGVTVLFFQLNFTGVTLVNSSGASVSLLSSSNPVPIDVSELQTDSAFVANQSVPAGTYSSLSLTFANPQLTIFNGSGSSIGSCAYNSVCQLTPSTTPLVLTFSTAPFPLTLTANAPLAFEVDVHLNTVIQPDLSVNLASSNGVTVSEVAPPSAGIPTPALGHLLGTVQSLASNSFTIQTVEGRTLSIEVNSSTIYNLLGCPVPTDGLTCTMTSTTGFGFLRAGETVNVTVSLQPDGTLLASQVDYAQAAGNTTVRGNIIQLTASNGNTLMDLIVQQAPAGMGALLGQRITITVPPTGLSYVIDSDGFTLPSGPAFASAANLEVGQEVSVVLQSIVASQLAAGSTPILGPALTTGTAASIALEPSQFTGVVNGVFPINVSGLNFVVSTEPMYLLPPAVTTMAAPAPVPINFTVQATSATTFTNLNPESISGLAAGDVISVKGWLFPYGVIPLDCLGENGCAPLGQIAAEAIVGRPGPAPLF